MQDTRSDIKFTVIIPTRERWDTLEWALKTCTTQNHANFEIIVSDNFSQDRTREVVEANKDPRVRYINTGKRLSMTANFEFALSHATGDYVCFIGDDDGLMPNALQDLNELLHQHDIDAITWKKPKYCWDNWHLEEYKNVLELSLDTKLRKFNSREVLQEILTFESDRFVSYFDLPCLYHGFVKKDILDDLRSRNGRVFNSVIPDVYAGVAVTCITSHFWHSARPLSILGVSSHSIGGDSQNSASLREFLTELEDGLAFHPNFQIVARSIFICTAESFFQAQQYLPEAAGFEFNTKGFVKKAMVDAAVLSPETYRSVIASLRHFGEVFDIRDYVEQVIAEHPITPKKSHLNPGFNFISNYFVCRFDSSRVRNVFDAARECKEILDRSSKVFFLREANRFLVNSLKNYGIARFANRAFTIFRRGYKAG